MILFHEKMFYGGMALLLFYAGVMLAVVLGIGSASIHSLPIGAAGAFALSALGYAARSRHP